MATIDEMKAELARLKGTSLKLSKTREEEATIAAEIVAEQKRIDEEGAAALEKLANIREAEAWAMVPEASTSSRHWRWPMIVASGSSQLPWVWSP